MREGKKRLKVIFDTINSKGNHVKNKHHEKLKFYRCNLILIKYLFLSACLLLQFVALNVGDDKGCTSFKLETPRRSQSHPVCEKLN